MKKLIVFVLAVVGMITLTSCMVVPAYITDAYGYYESTPYYGDVWPSFFYFGYHHPYHYYDYPYYDRPRDRYGGHPYVRTAPPTERRQSVRPPQERSPRRVEPRVEPRREEQQRPPQNRPSRPSGTSRPPTRR